MTVSRNIRSRAGKRKRRTRKHQQKGNKKACRKLNMNNIVSSKLLDNYLKEGWAAITKNYKEKKEKPLGKERVINKNNKANYFNSLSKQQQKLTLEILGSVRKYLVEQIFRCQGKIEDNEYFAAGSTNRTSDYDLTIRVTNKEYNYDQDITLPIDVHFFWPRV